MNNQQRGEGKKPSYQEQLAARCADAWSQMMESGDDGGEQFYGFVKQVALESWKNGVEAGRKRASNPAPKHDAPRVAKVYSKGSALKNGKLTPVEPALVVEEGEE